MVWRQRDIYWLDKQTVLFAHERHRMRHPYRCFLSLSTHKYTNLRKLIQ